MTILHQAGAGVCLEGRMLAWVMYVEWLSGREWDMKIISMVMGLAAGLFFGLATPFSKLALSHLNSFQLAGLLYLGAALTFLPSVLNHGTREVFVHAKGAKKKYILGIVVFGGLLGPLFLMLALQTANSMSVSIWLNLELAATAILGVLLFKDHLGRYAVIGVALTLIAGMVISWQEGISGIVSGVFVLLACVCWAFDNHLTAIIDGLTPQATTFIKGLAGGDSQSAYRNAMERMGNLC